MIEPSLEEMMRYMIEGKRHMLYVSLVFLSLIFGLVGLFLFVINKYFIPDTYSIFVKGTYVFLVLLYLFFLGSRLYRERYAKNRTPFGGGVYVAYYECMKCESIHGGIFGKGPTKRVILNTDCVHEWNAMDRKSFEEAYQLKQKNK